MSKYKDYDGSGFPSDIETDTIVEVVLRSGETLKNFAGVFDWSYVESDADNDIVAYTTDVSDKLEG